MPRLHAVEPIAEAINHERQSDEYRRDLGKLTWLRSDEACDYLRYVGKHRLRSLYRFLAEHGIATARRGRKRLLIARADLDRAIGARRTA